MNKSILTLIIFYCFHCSVNGQNRLINGVVSDMEGELLQGVTIRSLTSHTAAQSNAKGEFEILISAAKDTLQVTHIGYELFRMPIDTINISSLHLLLKKDIRQMDEVVINTGYENITKERLTGSTYTLDNKILNQVVSTNILDRMEAVTSGMLVDKRMAGVTENKYQIRGLSTLTEAIQSPLVILDNFPYEGNINNINPNDVESITVLKDAAAASIWGARAGNGVIVITTKKAKKNQRPQVSLNSNITITEKPDLMGTPQIPVRDFIELQKNLFEQGFYDWRFTDSWQTPIPAVAEILNDKRTGGISAEEANRRLDSLAGNDVRRDMARYLYRTELRSQTAINVTGATGIARYLLSAGFDKNQQSLRGNDDQRITMRTDNTFDFTKNWSVSTGMIYTKSQSRNNSPGGYGSFSGSGGQMAPYTRLADDSGNPLPVDLYYRGVYTDTAGAGRLLDWKYRPLQQLAVNDISSKNTDLLLNLGTSYRVTDWLTADVKYQYQQSLVESAMYDKPDNYYIRDEINQFTQIQGNVLNYALPVGGRLYSTESNKSTHQVRGQLNVNRKWTKAGEITAMIGGEIRNSETDYRTSSVYGINEFTRTSQPINFVTQHPTYNGIRGNKTIPDGNILNKFISRFVSLYGNASYTYARKYTLYASARRDASNIFGVRTNQKWQPLWSAGGLWRLSAESFYKASWLPVLSVKMSYGSSGNLDPTTSALLRIRYYNASISPVRLPSVYIENPQNDDLRWERVKTFNAGFDFALKSNRLSGSVEYYRKRSEDLISTVSLDPTVGFTTLIMNAAGLKNKGVDIVLNSINLNRKVTWSTTLLFSYADYYVDKMSYEVSETGLTTTGTMFPIKGYNPYAIIVYPFAGLDPATGDPLSYVNGIKTKDYNAIRNTPLSERTVYRSAVPPYYGSLRNSIGYKGLSLAFTITYQLGHYFLSPSLNYGQLFETGNGHVDYVDRWQQPGDEHHTTVPSMIYPAVSMRDEIYNRSSVNVVKAGQIRLHDIFLSYDYSPKTLRSFRSAQLYCYVNQLNKVIWKANNVGLDPNVLYGVRPRPNLAVGIKLNF